MRPLAPLWARLVLAAAAGALSFKIAAAFQTAPAAAFAVVLAAGALATIAELDRPRPRTIILGRLAIALAVTWTLAILYFLPRLRPFGSLVVIASALPAVARASKRGPALVAHAGLGALVFILVFATAHSIVGTLAGPLARPELLGAIFGFAMFLAIEVPGRIETNYPEAF